MVEFFERVSSTFSKLKLEKLQAGCPPFPTDKLTSTWNPKQPFINGFFNWMIPNLYLGNGWKSPNIHPFINGCLGFQVLIRKSIFLLVFEVFIVTEMVFVKFIVDTVPMSTWTRVYYNNTLCLVEAILESRRVTSLSFFVFDLVTSGEMNQNYHRFAPPYNFTGKKHPCLHKSSGSKLKNRPRPQLPSLSSG